MNNKRLYLILIIVGAVIAIPLVIYFFFWPFGDGGPSTQPTAPPDEVPRQPFDPSRPPTRTTPEGPAPDVNDPAEQERQAQEALKRQALDFAARQGSYSSVDEFSSMRQVYPQAADAVVTFLEERRQTLVNQYPSFGPSYGRTTRSLSASILDGTPILDGQNAVVAVQAQITINGTNGSETTSYERITLTYTRSGDSWLVSHIESEPMSL